MFSFQLFPSEQGLATVQALLNHLRNLQQEKELRAATAQAQHESRESDYIGVIYELEEMEKVLYQGVQENRAFRISIPW